MLLSLRSLVTQQCIEGFGLSPVTGEGLGLHPFHLASLVGFAGTAAFLTRFN